MIHDAPRSGRSVALHQPRVELAGVQPARAGRSARPGRAAVGARQVPRHRQQSISTNSSWFASAACSRKCNPALPAAPAADQISPHEQLRLIAASVRDLVSAQYQCLRELLPALEASGIVVHGLKDLTVEDRKHLRAIFRDQIFPVLTPLAIDPGHPFPHLLNKSLNLAVLLRRGGDPDPLYAVVQVPGVLPRFLALPEIPGEDKKPAACVHPARRCDPFASGRSLPRHGDRRRRRASASPATASSKSTTKSRTCSAPIEDYVKQAPPRPRRPAGNRKRGLARPRSSS